MADEEAQYYDEEDEPLPLFGLSNSDYEVCSVNSGIIIVRLSAVTQVD